MLISLLAAGGKLFHRYEVHFFPFFFHFYRSGTDGHELALEPIYLQIISSQFKAKFYYGLNWSSEAQRALDE